MNKYTHMFAFLMVIVFFGCAESKRENPNPKGLWRMEMNLGEGKPGLPFFITIDSLEGSLKAVLWNGKESMLQGDTYFRGDSLVIESSVYKSALVFHQRMNTMTGYWYDYTRPGNYRIPITGKFNLNHRFRLDSVLSPQADGKWEATFSPGTDSEYKALGLFQTDSFSLTGTFITETGDYRYLDGGFDGRSFKLSTFDGAHAFLFDAIKEGNQIKGTFYSGNHYQEPFFLERNDSFELTNPYTLTKPTQEKVNKLQGIDLSGNPVDITDVKIENGLLLQVMGSWCPNCYDESRFLTENHAELQKKGVAILALAFEKLDTSRALAHLANYRDRMNIPYPIWYMGNNSKATASEKISFLDEIKSYPTLIYLNGERKIISVHTGYYGPGTGELYDLQNQRFFKTIQEVLSTQ
jgi:thiol-disulfide isomerase/thioredoxin